MENGEAPIFFNLEKEATPKILQSAKRCTVVNQLLLNRYFQRTRLRHLRTAFYTSLNELYGFKRASPQLAKALSDAMG